jgi:predicted transcriptional regulator
MYHWMSMPDELAERLDAALDELFMRAAPPVLKLFRERGQDASAILRFLRDVQSAPHIDPSAERDVRIALENLKLHMREPPASTISRIPLRTLEKRAARILKYLRTSRAAKTISEIAYTLDIDRKTVRNRLKILEESGLVVKTDKHHYTATKPPKNF